MFCRCHYKGQDHLYLFTPLIKVFFSSYTSALWQCYIVHSVVWYTSQDRVKSWERMFPDATEMSEVMVRFRMSEQRFLGPGALKPLEPASSQQAVRGCATGSRPAGRQGGGDPLQYCEPEPAHRIQHKRRLVAKGNV